MHYPFPYILENMEQKTISMGSFLHQGFSNAFLSHSFKYIWTRGREAYSSSLLRSRPYKGSAGSNPAVSAKSGTLSHKEKEAYPR